MLIGIRDARANVGKVVTMRLTVDTVRDQKHMVFILGRNARGNDESLPLQLVLLKRDVPNSHEVSKLNPGSAIEVTGKIVESNQSKTDGLEMQVTQVVIHSSAMDRPIGDESSLDNRLNHRVVDLKSDRNQLMLKVRSTFENACRDYAMGWGCTEIHTPKLMGGASESGSEVFKVKYFEGEAFLAQSPQFYKQMAIATGLKGCFEIGPVFRAEQSRSSRHMTEFTGLDVELSWATELKDVMNFERDMLKTAFMALQRHGDDIQRLFGQHLPTGSADVITLDVAKAILGVKTGPEHDLTDEDERNLYAKTGKDLIFVTNYPISKRPFYHKWDDTQGITHSFDLIFRGIEITTGALREHDLERLTNQAIAKGVKPESIDDYLNNFRYGCPPHGGFGLGVERVIAKILGLDSVKEAAFVPRDPERLTP